MLSEVIKKIIIINVIQGCIFFKYSPRVSRHNIRVASKKRWSGEEKGKRGRKRGRGRKKKERGRKKGKEEEKRGRGEEKNCAGKRVFSKVLGKVVNNVMS